MIYGFAEAAVVSARSEESHFLLKLTLTEPF
jgi:hypothetical protein